MPTHPEAPAAERAPRVPVVASSERGLVSESVCVHVRPHPGPLPQERENHSAVAGEFGHAQFAMRFLANSKVVKTAQETSELPESADSCSLSPGERVKRSPRLCVTKALRRSSDFPLEEPMRSERRLDCRVTKAPRLLHPLPGGEGWGEGEPNHKLHPGLSVHADQD
jgi:hypothetical protein